MGGYKWTKKEHSWIWKEMLRQYEDSGQPPSLDTIATVAMALPKGPAAVISDVLLGLFNIEIDPNPKSLATTLKKRHAKIRAMDTITRVASAFDAGKDEAALKTLAREFSGGVSIERPEAKALVPQKLIRVPHTERIATGLYQVDEEVGGLARGELGIMMGVTNVGKSAASVTLGHSATAQHLKALQIDTENGELTTTTRYLSRFTGIPHKTIENNRLSPSQQERLDTWLARRHANLAAHLQVLYLGLMQSTLADVEAAWSELEGRGFVPDVVIFDSPDHLVMDDKMGSSRWERFAELYNRLAGMAQKHNVALWVMTQADLRRAEGKIATVAHTVDSQQKMRVASVVLTLNMIPGDDDPDKRCIYIAKHRARKARVRVDLATDLAVMKMKSPPPGLRVGSISEVEDEEEEVPF